ncbi:MAG: hypothetical protein KDA91_24785 [Planctomycetaceae bacterium]|nr:hypothetical protein [Planctomycetaceae bacterium]
MSLASSLSQNGEIVGGTLLNESFAPSAQLWNSSDAQISTHYSGEAGVDFVGIGQLQQSSAGYLAIASVADQNGYHDTVVSVISSANGLFVTQVSGLHNPGSVKGAQQIGSSIYYVTDGPDALDSVIHVIGSDEMIPVAGLLGDIQGVTDVQVNSLEFDKSRSIMFLQGTSELSGINKSWFTSITVTPEVPARPTPNFQHLPFQTNAQSIVSWDAVEGAASYVVQINDLTRKSIERKVTANANQLDVTLANAGQYAIWVQAVGTTGKPSPWSDGATFSVVNQPPAISYSSGAFAWTDLGSASYRLWVNNSQGQKVIDHTTSDAELAQSLPPGSYTAWVKPDSSPWSSPYRFTVYHDAIAVNPLTTLDATPTISWAGATDGTYDVFVAFPNAPTTAVYRQTVSGNSVTLSPRARGVYKVWVRQLFPDRTVSRWGSGAMLDIAERPLLTLDGNVLSWTSYDGAAQYELWVSTSTTTDRIAVTPTFVSRTSLDLSTLTGLSSGSYRVWIRAVSDGSPGMFGISRWGYAKAFSV